MTNVVRSKRSSRFKRMQTVNDRCVFMNRIKKSLHAPKNDGLSLPMAELAAEIFTEVKNRRTLERLDVEEACRISQSTCVSPCSFVLALLYIERLKDSNQEYLERVAPSELFLVSLMVASKFLIDDGEEDEILNAKWASTGNLPLAYVNRLEKDFLNAIDWTVYVHDQDFWKRLHKLEQEIAYKEGGKRGWYSYTELSSLLETIQVTALVQTLMAFSSLFFAIYTAGLVTLVASTMIATQLPATVLSSTRSFSGESTNDLPIANNKSDKVHDDLTDVSTSLDEILGKTACNETCRFNENANGSNYEWWLNSAMVWISEPQKDLEDEERWKYEEIGTRLHEYKGTYDILGNLRVSWRQNLGFDFAFPFQDLRYYASYLPKLSGSPTVIR